MNNKSSKGRKSSKRGAGERHGLTLRDFGEALAALDQVTSVFSSLDPAEPGAAEVRQEARRVALRCLRIMGLWLPLPAQVIQASVIEIPSPPGTPEFKS